MNNQLNKKIPPLSFKTKRLIVRPLQKSDYLGWKAAYLEALPRQNEFDESLLNKSKGKYSEFLKLYRLFETYKKQGVIYQLFAFDKKNNQLIGSTQYASIQRYNIQKSHLGYWIFNNYWRQGYGYELANGMIEHAFHKIKLHRLEAEIMPNNKPSIYLLKKLGMKRDGIRKKTAYVNGEWVDQIAFYINAEDRGLYNMKPNRILL